MRRLKVLASHLQSEPLPNIRPGDDVAKQVATSFFVKDAFAPRTSELSIQIAMAAAVVKGDLSTELSQLRGCFYRIGPNPQFDFKNKPYHVFDGDGMIHQIQFHGDGTLTYRNKFIRTEAYELDTGRNFSFSIMGEAAEYKSTGSMSWLKYAQSPMGRANTALISHNNRLLALFEQDVPYSIDPESLETLGKVLDYGTMPFTAHPKVCAINGDMIYFGYINGPRKGPFCHYGVVDANGQKICSFPINVPAPVMMHDIAITSTRSIFFDYNNQYHSPKEIMTGQAKSMYVVDKSLSVRFGILPRYAQNDKNIVWIDVPFAVVFHFLNAWDEGDEVVVWGCAASSIDLDNIGGDNSRTSGGIMTCWRFNVVEGYLIETFTIGNPTPNHINSNETAVDFAQLPANKVGVSMRYGYATVFCAGFKADGIVKYDLLQRQTNTYRFEQGVFSGEAMFIEKDGKEEDDGWLMCFVYGDTRCESALAVIDAKTMTEVARIAVPARVPAGFHACWKPYTTPT